LNLESISDLLIERPTLIDIDINKNIYFPAVLNNIILREWTYLFGASVHNFIVSNTETSALPLGSSSQL